MADPLLEVTNLRKYFPVRSSGLLRRTVGQLQAVDGISFTIAAGQAVGLVGESGCGKSTTARLVTRLLEPTSGSIRFEGREIGQLDRKQMLPFRREIQMVFQDPYSSLNPRQTVGAIVGAPLQVHDVVPREQVPGRVRELLATVGLDPDHYNRYPSEFSGGQRQRVAVARALALRPRLLVADEPVSALDVSVRAQVMNLLQDLQHELGIAYLFIAHDLAVVRQFCTDVAVMYLGKIVEVAPRDRLYRHAHHPYTQALLSAVPDLARATAGEPRERIRLQAEVPSAVHPPSGCRFRTRCWRAQDICSAQEPPLLQIAPGHHVACHFAGERGSEPGMPITQRLLGVDERGTPVAHRTPAREEAQDAPGADTVPGPVPDAGARDEPSGGPPG